MSVTRVAVACQGGGTHAAFTGGVLAELLAAQRRFADDPDGGDRFEVTSLSGTSAGALCAMAAWYGLAPNRADATLGSPEAAIERLDHLWATFTATTPAEQTLDRWLAAAMRWSAAGMPTMNGGGPYDPATELALSGMEALGARPEYLGFPALLRSLCPHFDDVDWEAVAERRLRIVAGAIEVISGNTETFDSDVTLRDMGLLPHPADAGDANRWRMHRPLSLAGIAASGTLPQVLPAEAIEDMVFPTCDPDTPVRRTGYYWDGMYSQNPPVRDLLDVPTVDDKPDEIWVIRINPQEYSPASLRVGLDEIHDRENDLAGNLSLNQELDSILMINRWIERHGREHPPLDTRKVITVRTIKMDRDTAWGLAHHSKLDRSAGHIRQLRDEGRRVGADWIEAWRAAGAGFDRYPDDARYPDAAAVAPRRGQ